MAPFDEHSDQYGLVTHSTNPAVVLIVFDVDTTKKITSSYRAGTAEFFISNF